MYISTNYRDFKNQFCSSGLKLERNLIINRDRGGAANTHNHFSKKEYLIKEHCPNGAASPLIHPKRKEKKRKAVKGTFKRCLNTWMVAKESKSLHRCSDWQVLSLSLKEDKNLKLTGATLKPLLEANHHQHDAGILI